MLTVMEDMSLVHDYQQSILLCSAVIYPERTVELNVGQFSSIGSM